jgi:hypothetical protein
LLDKNTGAVVENMNF